MLTRSVHSLTEIVVEISLSPSQVFPCHSDEKNNYSDCVSPGSPFLELFVIDHGSTSQGRVYYATDGTLKRAAKSKLTHAASLCRLLEWDSFR